MNTILVALDGSAVAPVVLREAVSLARRLDARLLLARAVTVPVAVPMEIYVEPQDRLADLLLKNAQRELDALAQQVPPDRLAGTRVEFGTPWSAICALAKSENVGLILIGSHGYGALDRLLGTTAARVVNHADRSVYVVRHPDMHA